MNDQREGIPLDYKNDRRKVGEMNITFFALGMRMAVGGTIDRQKPATNGGKRAFKRSLFFVYT